MNKITLIKKYILSNKYGEIEEDRTFREITTVHLGGKISLLYYPNTINNFIEVINYIIKLNVKWMIIGLGSNLLCSDNIYDGVVVSFKKMDISYYKVKDNLYLSSQYPLSCLYKKIGSYYLFDKLSLIPGTVGGGVVSNCGVFGNSISEIIDSVLIYDSKKIKWIDGSCLNFGYRTSVFKEKDYIILFVKIKLYRVTSNYEIYKNEKKRRQKVQGYNAGSTFKNPPGYKAWELIRDNAKTLSVGNCSVCSKHFNFLVNNGMGKSEDMYILSESIKNEVYEKTKICLEYEWKIVNF